MHELPMRQLFSACLKALAVFAGMLFFTAGVEGADADAKPAPAGIDEELKAAQIMEESVMTGIGTEGKSEPSQEDLKKIAHIYQQIVERNPKNAKAWNAEAEFLWRIDRHRDAMAEWMNAETLDPTNAVVANHLGGCHIELGNAKIATEFFEQATKLDPRNALYQFNAGNTCFLFRHQMTNDANNEQAVLSRSLDHFRMASQIEPFNIEYAQAYAQAFYSVQSPDWNTALIAWNHYLEITDQKDFAYSNLARINLKLGHKKEARDDLAKIESKKFDILKNHLLLQIGTD